MRQFLIAGAFGQFWHWTIAGAATTRFAKGLGMPDPAFGVLAALPFAGALLQLPASYWLERFGMRKRMVLISVTGSRLSWVALAAIPWVSPPGWRWRLMLVAAFFGWGLLHSGVPAWFSWIADIVPAPVRGRFNGFRRCMGQVIGFVATIGVGYLLDVVDQAGPTGGDIMLQVTSVILAIAGLTGAMEAVWYHRIDDQAAPAPQRGSPWLSMLGGPLRDAGFRRYLAFNFTYTFSIAYIGQYIWLYAFDILGFNNWTANLLLLALPLLGSTLSYPAWGRVVDRLGKKPALIFGGVLTVIGPLGWLICTPENIWVGYPIVFVSILGHPGVEMGNFNILLGLSDARDKRGGSTYVAVNSVFVSTAGIAAGLFAAVVAARWQTRSVGVLGIDLDLTYHGLLFLIASGLRVVSLGWALTLQEPEATGTRDALRFMTASLYSNVRQAVLMPTRVVGRLARRTYRIR